MRLTCGLVGVDDHLLLLAPGGARQGLQDVVLGKDLGLGVTDVLSKG